MIYIEVDVKQLLEIRSCFEDHEAAGYSDGPYAAAREAGWPGFTVGLDHVADTHWAFFLFDRCLSSRDNSVKFFVPQKDREGAPTVATAGLAPAAGRSLYYI